MKRKKVFKITFFFFIYIFLRAQSTVELSSLDTYIISSMEKYGLPGLSIGIVKGDSTVFLKAYGTCNTSTGVELTVNSLFGIASLSKAFTAASIGILVDEGLLKWDDHVIDHLPEFKLYDAYATREMRIRDLLCHRSGLATFDGDLLWYGTDYSRDEIIERISKMEPKNSFRYQYGYQNVMFVVAGEIIHKVTGKTWDEFVSNRILKRTGMRNTTTTNSVFSKGIDLAMPHLDGKPQHLINYDNCGPAASINSSAADMVKWIRLWLNKGLLNDSIRVFSETVYRTITSSHTALYGGRGDEIGGTHFNNAALGWFLSDYAGRKVLSHGGGLPGYISQLKIVPEDTLGVIVLTNDDSRLASAVADKVLDIYLTGKDIDYAERSNKRYQTYKESYWNHIKEIENPVLPSLPKSDYAGKYLDKMYGTAEITLTDGELYFAMIPTQKLFSGKLLHHNMNTFRVKLKDPFLPEGLVTFHFNSRGKIEEMTIDLPNPDFHFYNLKFKRTEE
ncbi:MAG: serine hydrolase [Melioribacteraceae bacterium]|nr:serine hydrolase [Melioribacteraceae bacterium]